MKGKSSDGNRAPLVTSPSSAMAACPVRLSTTRRLAFEMALHLFLAARDIARGQHRIAWLSQKMTTDLAYGRRVREWPGHRESHRPTVPGCPGRDGYSRNTGVERRASSPGHPATRRV